MRKLLALVAVVSLAACGGDDDDGASQVEREPASTTSTTVDVESAFMAEVDENTDGSGGDAEIIEFGWSICQALDGAQDVALDDAPADTPESDESVTDQMVTMGLDTVMAAELDDDLTAVIMRAAGGELCPAHYGSIVTYLNAR